MEILEALNESFKKGDCCGETIYEYDLEEGEFDSYILRCQLNHPKYPKSAGATTATARFNWKENTMTVKQNASCHSVTCDIPEDLMEHKPFEEPVEEVKQYEEIEVKFDDKTLNFIIATDVPDFQIDACIINWAARNQDNLTAKSLVDYINSKTGMTGHTAMTIP
jgi:hypothetical protein